MNLNKYLVSFGNCDTTIIEAEAMAMEGSYAVFYTNGKVVGVATAFISIKKL